MYRTIVMLAEYLHPINLLIWCKPIRAVPTSASAAVSSLDMVQFCEDIHAVLHIIVNALDHSFVKLRR